MKKLLGIFLFSFAVLFVFSCNEALLNHQTQPAEEEKGEDTGLKKLSDGSDVVLLKILVNEEGKVEEYKIIDTTNPNVNKTAVEFVMNQTYQPRWEQGRKIKYWREIEVPVKQESR